MPRGEETLRVPATRRDGPHRRDAPVLHNQQLIMLIHTRTTMTRRQLHPIHRSYLSFLAPLFTSNASETLITPRTDNQHAHGHHHRTPTNTPRTRRTTPPIQETSGTPHPRRRSHPRGGEGTTSHPQDLPHRRTDPKPPRHQAEEAYKTYTVRLNSRAEKSPRTNQPQKHDTTPITRATPRRKTHKPTDQPPPTATIHHHQNTQKKTPKPKTSQKRQNHDDDDGAPPGGVHARGDTENIISVMSGSTP